MHKQYKCVDAISRSTLATHTHTRLECAAVALPTIRASIDTERTHSPAKRSCCTLRTSRALLLTTNNLAKQHSLIAHNKTMTTTIVNHSAVRAHALLANMLLAFAILRWLTFRQRDLSSSMRAHYVIATHALSRFVTLTHTHPTLATMLHRHTSALTVQRRSSTCLVNAAAAATSIRHRQVPLFVHNQSARSRLSQPNAASCQVASVQHANTCACTASTALPCEVGVDDTTPDNMPANPMPAAVRMPTNAATSDISMTETVHAHTRDMRNDTNIVCTHTFSRIGPVSASKSHSRSFVLNHNAQNFETSRDVFETSRRRLAVFFSETSHETSPRRLGDVSHDVSPARRRQIE